MDELWGLDSAVFGVLLSSCSLGTSKGTVVGFVQCSESKKPNAQYCTTQLKQMMYYYRNWYRKERKKKKVFMLFSGGKHVSTAPAGPAHCQGAL